MRERIGRLARESRTEDRRSRDSVVVLPDSLAPEHDMQRARRRESSASDPRTAHKARASGAPASRLRSPRRKSRARAARARRPVDRRRQIHRPDRAAAFRRRCAMIRASAAANSGSAAAAASRPSMSSASGSRGRRNRARRRVGGDLQFARPSNPPKSRSRGARASSSIVSRCAISGHGPAQVPVRVTRTASGRPVGLRLARAPARRRSAAGVWPRLGACGDVDALVRPARRVETRGVRRRRCGRPRP